LWGRYDSIKFCWIITKRFYIRSLIQHELIKTFVQYMYMWWLPLLNNFWLIFILMAVWLMTSLLRLNLFWLIFLIYFCSIYLQFFNLFWLIFLIYFCSIYPHWWSSILFYDMKTWYDLFFLLYATMFYCLVCTCCSAIKYTLSIIKFFLLDQIFKGYKVSYICFERIGPF
jgi:hypothetical protein